MRRPGALWTAIAQVVGLACGVALFSFLLVESVGPYFQTGPAPGAPEAAFRAELGQSVPRILRHFHVPGMVISTVTNGTPANTYAYGYADVAAQRPVAADTVFRVASISKSVTAWGVMRLVEAHKMELDQPATRYLRPWPLARSAFPTSQVTVRRLLTHTSGVNGGEDSFHAPGQRGPSARNVIAWQGPVGAAPGPATLVAPPGGYIYSVPGYMLLQLMIEQQSGLRFTDYMQQTVLKPLGMTSSGYTWGPGLRDRMATPYGPDGQPIPLMIPDDTAADALLATAPDLARFVAAPMADSRAPAGAGVLSPATIGQVYSPEGQPPNGQFTSVAPDAPGIGYFVESAPGQPTMMTNVGLDPGWSSLFVMSPSTGDGIVILTNSEVGAPAIAQVMSIWTSWRGLPSSNLSRGYRTFGVAAAVFLSLLAALDVTYAAGLAMETLTGRRRIGLGIGAGLSGALLELGLTATALALWAGVFAAVRTMPTMNVAGMGVIGVLVVVTISRVVFPIYDPDRSSSGKGAANAALAAGGFATP